MTLRIVTDSTCDLPDSIVAARKISVVPLYINVGARGYRDGVDMTRQEFYERLPEWDPPPTTAAPGPQMLHHVYQQLVEEGATEILSIHISESLSAVMGVATTAAEQFKAAPVTAWDSQSLSMGTGFLVEAAAQAAEEGRSVDEILGMLEELTTRTYVFAALDTLEFLKRGGRMNAAVAALGKVMKVKPLLRMNRGNATADRVRTTERAERQLVGWLEELVPLERVALVHANAPERAECMRRRVAAFLPPGDVPSVDITSVLGAHLGPGACGFACISEHGLPA
jgi:DegV family protein with EDD domain